MNMQILSKNGDFMNQEVKNILDFDEIITNQDTAKISFDFLGGMLVLRPDGTYQIFGGLINYPRLYK